MVNLKELKGIPFGTKFRFLGDDGLPTGDFEHKSEKHADIAPETLVAVEEPLKQKKPPKASPKDKAKTAKKPPAKTKPVDHAELHEELAAARKLLAEFRRHAKGRGEPSGLVRITRSFAYKHNIGNYQSVDFFCSQQVQCKAEDAEAKADQVIAFCKAQVKRDLEQFKADQQRHRNGHDAPSGYGG